ncbi:hypothetical protein BGZ88_003720 [Linnemannia elongata]|nr:hypothetical protein BGZ88_003720 [Linnemannia elongata]
MLNDYKAASSEIAHETSKKIASDRKTLPTHDIDEAFEIPMDPIQDTTEEARNVQKAIRQSGTEAHSVEEEEETLMRKKPSSRTHLRFRNPLSLSNPPGKKKQTTA